MAGNSPWTSTVDAMIETALEEATTNAAMSSLWTCLATAFLEDQLRKLKSLRDPTPHPDQDPMKTATVDGSSPCTLTADATAETVMEVGTVTTNSLCT